MTGALEGTTVIEVTGHVAGPYAGCLLGDLGCEVIPVWRINQEGNKIKGRVQVTEVGYAKRAGALLSWCHTGVARCLWPCGGGDGRRRAV